MHDLTLHQSFEGSKHIQGDLEFRFARELMPLLGYKTRQKFEETIARAKQSCENFQMPVTEHFLPEPVKNTTLKR
ncbi:MAG: hypothetical protein LBI53_00830 [Candidatus Peribacteria bacterium]|jgi:hypothetical protein|nr:hypothetical protein [Candidatus Peribacteria bacterium]